MAQVEPRKLIKRKKKNLILHGLMVGPVCLAKAENEEWQCFNNYITEKF